MSVLNRARKSEVKQWRGTGGREPGRIGGGRGTGGGRRKQKDGKQDSQSGGNPEKRSCSTAVQHFLHLSLTLPVIRQIVCLRFDIVLKLSWLLRKSRTKTWKKLADYPLDQNSLPRKRKSARFTTSFPCLKAIFVNFANICPCQADFLMKCKWRSCNIGKQWSLTTANSRRIIDCITCTRSGFP